MRDLHRPAFIILMMVLSFAYSRCGKYDGAFAESDGSLKLHEAALLLAGKDVPKNSKLYSYAATAFFKAYKSQMETGWSKFQRPNMQKIKGWWQNYKPAAYRNIVLYPFSGPDIMNALTFYPDADTYVMFGLEPPGVIPAPQAMTPDQITRGLNGLKRSLGDILQMNFFKTEGMAAELSSKSFNGITGLIMCFLAINGYTVLDANKIAINAESNVVSGITSDEKISWQKPPKARIPGIEISFRMGSGKTQKVQYFMLNVIDNALAEYSPNFVPYLKKQGPYAVVIKSASYLMHNDKVKFTRIRAVILATTDYLVQDDSGIPLRYFKPSDWKLGFHGYYDGPIGLFRNRMQPDLKKAMAARSTGILPFSYGYDHKPGQSNLMTAEKIK
jgi:hypothetical protein